MVYLLALAALAAALAVAPGVLVLTNTKAQLAAVVFGAMLVFQSSSGLTPAKLAYLAALGAVVAISLDRSTPRIGISVAPGLVLLVLTMAAIVQGNSPMWVVRDASNYLLLVAAAPLAAHFGHRLSERTLFRTMLGAGLLGAYAYVARLTSVRGLANLPSPAVPSTMLFGLIVAIASAKAVTSRQKAKWWALTTLLFVTALLTGTRNMLLLLLIPAAILTWSYRQDAGLRRGARRAFRIGLLVIPAAAFLSLTLAQATDIDTSAALARVATIVDIRDRTGAGQSLEERSQQQRLAWTAFTDSPVLGAGPGTVWRWTRVNGREAVGVSMDTSVVILAKWGLLGSATMLLLLISWVRFLTRVRPPTVWALVAVGLVPFALLQSVFASLVEDRGLPLVLILLGAASVSSARAESEMELPSSDAALTTH